MADWPNADRIMLEALRRKGGLFDDDGGLADLRASSMTILTRSWGRWLEWLRLNDPAALEDPPATRATLPRLRGWLDSQRDLRPTSRQMFYTGVLRLLRAVAPQADWSAHQRVQRSLARAAGRGDPARKAGRIMSSQVLLDAALLHGVAADNQKATPRQRAVQLRDSAMVALLAMMPMRHQALTGLSIGTTLLVGTKVLTVLLPEDLTKNGQVWESDVPEPAAGLLRRYLSEARPFLLQRSGKQHDMLWICNNGDPMSYSYVGRKVAAITLALTGKAIPPHFFRDAAATTLARTSPAAARLIRPVLGHRNFKTAERHYIHADMIDACRDYAALQQQMKKGK